MVRDRGAMRSFLALFVASVNVSSSIDIVIFELRVRKRCRGRKGGGK